MITQTTWRLMDDAGALPPAVFEAGSALWRGAARAHDSRRALEVARPCGDGGGQGFAWRLRRTGGLHA